MILYNSIRLVSTLLFSIVPVNQGPTLLQLVQNKKTAGSIWLYLSDEAHLLHINNIWGESWINHLLTGIPTFYLCRPVLGIINFSSWLSYTYCLKSNLLVSVWLWLLYYKTNFCNSPLCIPDTLTTSFKFWWLQHFKCKTGGSHNWDKKCLRVRVVILEFIINM